MVRQSRLYVLADGAHARLVHRGGEPPVFVTAETMDHTARLDAVRAALHDHTSGRTHESVGSGGYPVGRNGEVRREKAAFMQAVADRAVHVAAARHMADVVIVAPPRMAPVLRAAIRRRLKVAAEIHRDLVKVADSDLEVWLAADRIPSLKTADAEA